LEKTLLTDSISGVIAELVALDIPRCELTWTIEDAFADAAESAPREPIYWYTHRGEGDDTTVLHICGEEWQVEVIAAPADLETGEGIEIRAINLEAVAIGSLGFWPGLARAQSFALMAREIWEQCCQEEWGAAWDRAFEAREGDGAAIEAANTEVES
jgi:hypothetical protein